MCSFMYPWIRHVTVRTGRTYTAAIGEVNGLLVFLVYVVFHFMTGNTEVQCIGRFHRSVKTTPENDADYHEKQGSTKRGAK